MMLAIFATLKPITVALISIAAFLLLSGIACFFILGHILYVMHLKRTRPDKWTRECSSPEPDQLKMYNEGLEWSNKYAESKKDLHIVNEGLNLYGEYYDFGYDKALIFIAGRTEGLRYGYYFSKPYPECGFNVLTIDPRAHGESDGKFNTLGYEEHKDIIAWAKLLHDEYSVKSIILHGICIGSSCALMTLVSEDCPDYIKGMIAEGMYPCFAESFKNHMIELKKPIFPALQIVDMWMRIYTGHSMMRGNINIIDKLQKPILMLHSKEDIYSTPENAQKLFDKIPHSDKELVWFEHGAHSKLRITDTEKYDSSIKAFLSKNFAYDEVVK
jgi:pimeloyl-ACP methyl ester carboxylesterase